jgi:tetratricopeptide (TPR) repeat protein
LREYASIELLLVQNRVDEALARLQEFQVGREIKLSKEEVISRNINPQQIIKNMGDSAIVLDNSMMSTAILDDVYWLEAKLRIRRGEFVLADSLLGKIVKDFGDDILADDAYFAQGDLYETQLNNKDKAMEIYRTFLERFPGSVYAAEARKRYRTLRGDFQDKVVN